MEIRYITTDEILEAHIAVERANGVHGNEADLPLIAGALQDGRGVAAVEDGDIVGYSIAYPLEMNVEGGMLPTTLVDGVGVLPTHRRRGILNQMMDFHLLDFHERGETLSGLGASEAIIYGRYGYGIGSMQVDFSIDRREAGFTVDPSPQGKYKFIDKNDALHILPDVAERASCDRPGFLKGTESLWKLYLSDPESRHEGASELFHVTYEEGGQIDGYITYRTRRDTLIIHEMISASSQAHTALWKYCFGVDLMARIDAPKRPVDDPLPPGCWQTLDACNSP
jgi:predicted acetyltransferase